MTTRVTLSPYAPDAAEALSALKVASWQVVFSGQPREFVEAPEDGCDIHLIRREDALVGMFRIDRHYHRRHTFAQADTPGMRSFIVDADRQGEGIGTATVMAMPGYIRTHYPLATAIYLTVNLRNPGAIKAYLRGGFTDTGAEWPHGLAGPQKILRLPLL